jgi:chemotaxis protein methyltransferase CheR
MLDATPDIQPMSDEEFRLLRDQVYGHCGIYFDEGSRYLLEKRLSRRLSHLSMTTFRDYYYYLRYDPNRDQEFVELMDILTTNETYFFREDFQLKAFTEEILPERMAVKEALGDRTLRIWSAGCSSGEEPYTLSMLLLQQKCLAGWRVEIIGSDISQRVLQLARKGVYGRASFRATDEYYIRTFFEEVEGGYRVNNAVRERVTLSQLNLFDPQRLLLLGKMDIIFCRNVIIYFDQTAKKQVIDNFYQMLQDSGFLLLGHSESLMNISTAFSLRHLKHDMVYQKALAK